MELELLQTLASSASKRQKQAVIKSLTEQGYKLSDDVATTRAIDAVGDVVYLLADANKILFAKLASEYIIKPDVPTPAPEPTPVTPDEPKPEPQAPAQAPKADSSSLGYKILYIALAIIVIAIAVGIYLGVPEKMDKANSGSIFTQDKPVEISAVGQKLRDAAGLSQHGLDKPSAEASTAIEAK